MLTVISCRLIINERLFLQNMWPAVYSAYFPQRMTDGNYDIQNNWTSGNVTNISHLLISRHRFDPQQRPLMVFAFRLIKWIELKNLSYFSWLRSFTASRPGTHIVSISGESVQLGTVESYGQTTGLRHFKWSTLCSYSALSKSMRLVYTVSQTVTFWNWLHRSILCILPLHEVEN